MLLTCNCHIRSQAQALAHQHWNLQLMLLHVFHLLLKRPHAIFKAAAAEAVKVLNSMLLWPQEGCLEVGKQVSDETTR